MDLHRTWTCLQLSGSHRLQPLCDSLGCQYSRKLEGARKELELPGDAAGQMHTIHKYLISSQLSPSAEEIL